VPRADKIPACPEPPSNRSTGLSSRDFSIRLVTPLFGGGAEAGEPDPSCPIRGTSIRGHLRFWWRATCGRLLSTKEMWRREEEIFGSNDFPGPLQVEVSCVQGIERVKATEALSPGSPVRYALFPAIENENELLADGLNFHLKIRWPTAATLQSMRAAQNQRREKARRHPLPPQVREIAPDIEAAMWAWGKFGGLGARTRRGVGAIHCEPLPAPGSLRPSLDARIFLGAGRESAIEAWQESIRVFREFRQTPRGKNHKKTIQTRKGPRSIDVPGRSHWPEADSIRRITGCSLKPPAGSSYPAVPADVDAHDHSVPVAPAALLPAFPRAALGLPINFHFADGPDENRPGDANKDPQDVQIVPLRSVGGNRREPAERMASPVITRPLFVDGRWCPAIVIFKAPHLASLEARIVGEHSMAGGGAVSVDVRHAQIADKGLGGIEPLRWKASAIDALIHYLTRAARFTEGTL
jgi:CRISPR-associated protein Cmr1